MQPPPKKTGYYSMLQEDEEESDYDESGSSSLSVKDKLTRHKKAIAINPTEGFRYSDIYMVSVCISEVCVLSTELFLVHSFIHLSFFILGCSSGGGSYH